jgi:hypothetical protein
MAKTIGGGNQFDVFPMTSSGGNWVVGTRIASLAQVIKTARTGHFISKNAKYELDQDQDGTEIDAIMAYLVPSNTQETGEYENGTPYGANSNSATSLLAFISYGGVNTGDNTRRVEYGVAQVSGGDITSESGKAVRTKLTFTVMENPVPLVIAAAKFDTAQLASPVLTTVAAKSVGAFVRLAKAT